MDWFGNTKIIAKLVLIQETFDSKFSEFSKQLNDLDERVTKIETNDLPHIYEHLARIDARLDGIEKRLDDMNLRLNDMSNRISDMNNTMCKILEVLLNKN